MRSVLLVLMLTVLSFPAVAESLGDKIKKGVGKAGDVVKQGADAVEEAVESTGELVGNEETPEATRAKLDAIADEVLAQLLAENAAAAQAFEASAGYAVFDMRRVSIFPLSAGYGRGVASPLPEASRTYMQMGTGGVGAAFGIGGFESQFVILFETAGDFEEFITHGYDAGADAGTMQGEERSTTEVQFVNGRSFFVLSKKGWRVNANATGTKYWKDPNLN